VNLINNMLGKQVTHSDSYKTSKNKIRGMRPSVARNIL